MIAIVSTRIMDVQEKHNFMFSIYTSARWVKLVQPAESMFLTPTLLMGEALRGTPAEPAS